MAASLVLKLNTTASTARPACYVEHGADMSAMFDDVWNGELIIRQNVCLISSLLSAAFLCCPGLQMAMACSMLHADAAVPRSALHR